MAQAQDLLSPKWTTDNLHNCVTVWLCGCQDSQNYAAAPGESRFEFHQLNILWMSQLSANSLITTQVLFNQNWTMKYGIW